MFFIRVSYDEMGVSTLNNNNQETDLVGLIFHLSIVNMSSTVTAAMYLARLDLSRRDCAFNVGSHRTESAQRVLESLGELSYSIVRYVTTLAAFR